MLRLGLILTFLFGLLQLVFCQSAADDSTIIRPNPTKSWPAGPYSEVITNYGILNTAIPLISLKGKGQTSLDLALQHRSYTTGNMLQFYIMGRGWSHSGVNYLFENNGLFRNVANRCVESWKANLSAGTWDRNPGTRNDVVAVSGGYKLTDYQTKNQYFYDRVYGSNYYYLTKVVDPFGNQVTYSYVGATNNLNRITDASGRYIEFTYGSPSGTTILTKVRLVCGASTRDWDFGYVDWDSNYHDYLDTITFPSPTVSGSRPYISFDSDWGGQITYLRTMSDSSTTGKLWRYVYGTTYPTTPYKGIIEVDQPWKANPAVVDSSHPILFNYSQVGSGGAAGDEIVCQITDPMGYVWKHAYYNDFAAGASAQTTSDFPNPIKRVYDPTVTRFLDPRNNQTPVSWNYWETYHWIPSTACCDVYTDREGNATTLSYYSGGTGGNLTNRGLVSSKSIVNQSVTYTDTFNYYSTPGDIREGKLANRTDAQGSYSTCSYDSTTGALTQTALDPAGQNITKNCHYTSFGEVDEEWAGSDPHTYYSNFDIYGNACTVTPPGALATNFTFDDFGNKLTVTPPSPQGTTTINYDLWNRPIRTTTPDTSYTENTYNLDSNVIDVRMEDGSHRTTTFNFLNLPSTITVPVDSVTANNLVTSTDYDYNGRRTTLTAPDGLQSTFLYNERGDLIKTSYSDGTNRQWGFDGNRNTVWRQNGRGYITYYFYDNLGRLLQIDYNGSGTPDVTFAYRKDGLRTSMVDVMGTSTWTYNNAKQTTGMYDAATNKSLIYIYQTGTGRPTSTVAPGNTWNYFYDSQTRPLYTTQSISGEIVRNSSFWDDGSVKKKAYPNNTKTEYGYDTRGRTNSIRHAVDSLDLTQEQLNYQYSNGNVSQYSLSINGGASYVTNYAHDYANRLLSEVRTDSVGLNGYNKSYVYTKGNDRASTTKNGTTSNYTYFTNTNRFKTGEGFTVNTYDNDGNPTSIATPGGTWTLTYDEDSRLTQIVKSNGTTSFKYNGDGRRVERATPTSTYRYLVNGENVVLTTTTSYNIQAYYSSGVGYFSGGKMRFYQENAQGSAVVVRDDAGNWESLTEYDAYGEEYDINGTQKSDFRFAGAHGYIKDDETGMELLGARYYLPVLGRFLNQDPIGLSGGLNLYGYCDNNPLSKLDPDGKQAQDPLSKFMEYWSHIFDSTDNVKRAFTPDMPMNSLPSNPSSSLATAYFRMWKSGDLKSVEKFNESSKEAIYLRDSWIGESIAQQSKGLKLWAKTTGAFGTAEALVQSVFNWDQVWANFQGAGNWSAFRDKSGIHVHYWNTVSYNSYALHAFGNIKDGGGMKNVTMHMYWTIK